MKKITSLMVAIFLIASVSAAVIIETNWQLSAATNPSTLPAWVGTGNLCRGLAFGKMGANERVFAISRQDGNLIHILNASTGADLGTMNMGTSVTEGTHVISDGGMTSDGKLLVSNMVLPGIFRVYLWDNETNPPIIAISYAITNGRYGDKITVTGNYNTGTAKVYAANYNVGTSKLLCWSMIPDPSNAGKFIFNQTPTQLFDVATTGTFSQVDVRPDGDIFYKTCNSQIIHYTAAGLPVDTTIATVVANYGITVRYIGKDALNNEYLCYFRAGATKEKLNILKLPNGSLKNATVIDSTATLGKNANGNSTCGVIVNVLPNNDVELYVLSTNNGIGKYTVKGLFTTTGTNDLSNSNVKVGYSKRNISVVGTQASSIELFNTLGQKVKSIVNSNELNTDNLKGVYIVQIKSEGKIVKTSKLSIR